jgi:hypothetical protein
LRVKSPLGFAAGPICCATASLGLMLGSTVAYGTTCEENQLVYRHQDGRVFEAARLWVNKRNPANVEGFEGYLRGQAHAYLIHHGPELDTSNHSDAITPELDELRRLRPATRRPFPTVELIRGTPFSIHTGPLKGAWFVEGCRAPNEPDQSHAGSMDSRGLKGTRGARR